MTLKTNIRRMLWIVMMMEKSRKENVVDNIRATLNNYEIPF